MRSEKVTFAAVGLILLVVASMPLWMGCSVEALKKFTDFTNTARDVAGEEPAPVPAEDPVKDSLLWWAGIAALAIGSYYGVPPVYKKTLAVLVNSAGKKPKEK